MSKWVKLTVIFHCGGASTSQIQFLLAGYSSGKDGEVIVPLTASINPPQASAKFLIGFIFCRYMYTIGVSFVTKERFRFHKNWGGFTILGFFAYFRTAVDLNAARSQFCIDTGIRPKCWNIRAHIHAQWDWNIRHTLQKETPIILPYNVATISASHRAKNVSDCKSFLFVVQTWVNSLLIVIYYWHIT